MLFLLLKIVPTTKETMFKRKALETLMLLLRHTVRVFLIFAQACWSTVLCVTIQFGCSIFIPKFNDLKSGINGS